MNLTNYLTKDRIKKITTFLKERGFENEEIRFGLKQTIDRFSKLPDRFKIYRLLKVNSQNQIDGNKLGAHWTLEKQNLIDNHYTSKEKCIISAWATEDRIILERTIELNVEYPNEMEILINNDGAGLEVIDIEC